MEELRKIAMAHYQASPDNIQALALDFFTAMDSDGDGKIDLYEFLAFMTEVGYTRMTNRCFFEKLDLDRNGTLDFWEVMALYYIVKSGRPFCDCCGDFIPGTYFTCVACLENPTFRGTFDLCLDCYLSQACDHSHQGISQFMDNYSLLEAKIRSTSMNQSQSLVARSRPPPTASCVQSSTSATPSTAAAIVPYSATNTVTPVVYHNTYIHNVNTSTHTVPSHSLIHYPAATATSNYAFIPERQKWKVALGALDAAIKIGAIGATISSCSIL